MLNVLRRLEQGLATLGAVAVVITLLIVLVFTVAQVVDRYGLRVAFNAWDQIAQLALVWLTFLGIALAIRDRVNIRVDLIDTWLSRRMVRLRDIATDVLVIALLTIVQVKIWRLVEIGGGQVIMGTPFTMSATFMGLAVGSGLAIALLSLRLIIQFAEAVRR
ncbi:MAG: TRAP transporter small permease [Hyphomicrobiales bacterium]